MNATSSPDDPSAEIEDSLRDVVSWTMILWKLIDDVPRLSSLSDLESSRFYEQIRSVSEELKRSVEDVDAIYHQRPNEEEEEAAA